MPNKLVVQGGEIPEYYVVDESSLGSWLVIDPKTSAVMGTFNSREDADFHAGYLDGQRHFGRMA